MWVRKSDRAEWCLSSIILGPQLGRLEDGGLKSFGGFFTHWYLSWNDSKAGLSRDCRLKCLSITSSYGLGFLTAWQLLDD